MFTIQENLTLTYFFGVSISLLFSVAHSEYKKGVQIIYSPFVIKYFYETVLFHKISIEYICIVIFVFPYMVLSVV